MALTGTASRAVLKDVQRELQIDDYEAIITPTTFDRSELRLRAMPCRSDEKMLRLRGVLEALPRQFGHSASTFFDGRGSHTQSGLVFCRHVKGDFGVVRVSEELARSLKRSVPFYAGGAPNGTSEFGWEEQKRRIASDYKRNRIALMTCTKAFGMGIDKPNIRYTVHYGLPPSIESFYQEAGRAGRDRRTAHCLVLFSNDFPDRNRRLLNPSMAVDALHREMKGVKWNDEDDITRALFFHAKAFSGIQADFDQMQAVLGDLGDISAPRNVVLSFDRDTKLVPERSIHRLSTIGVVADYTVDYSASKFHVRLSGWANGQVADSLYKYVAAYQRGQAKVVLGRVSKYLDHPHREFVAEAGRELIRFVYEVIERSRRQALYEMLALCEQCPDEASMRKRLLAYLGTSVFTESIERILDAADGGLAVAVEIIEGVRSALDASQLRGQSGRALESYPDHAGLRLLRAASEAMTCEPDSRTITENVEACVSFGASKYGLPLEQVTQAALDVVRIVADARPHLADPMLQGLMNAAEDKRLVARKLVEELPASMSEAAVGLLLSMTVNRLRTVLEG
jgi:ATP-dependent DNA helicase RecQ